MDSVSATTAPHSTTSTSSEKKHRALRFWVDSTWSAELLSNNPIKFNRPQPPSDTASTVHGFRFSKDNFFIDSNNPGNHDIPECQVCTVEPSYSQYPLIPGKLVRNDIHLPDGRMIEYLLLTTKRSDTLKSIVDCKLIPTFKEDEANSADDMGSGVISLAADNRDDNWDGFDTECIAVYEMDNYGLHSDTEQYSFELGPKDDDEYRYTAYYPENESSTQFVQAVIGKLRKGRKDERQQITVHLLADDKEWEDIKAKFTLAGEHSEKSGVYLRDPLDGQR